MTPRPGGYRGLGRSRAARLGAPRRGEPSRPKPRRAANRRQLRRCPSEFLRGGRSRMPVADRRVPRDRRPRTLRSTRDATAVRAIEAQREAPQPRCDRVRTARRRPPPRQRRFDDDLRPGGAQQTRRRREPRPAGRERPRDGRGIVIHPTARRGGWRRSDRRVRTFLGRCGEQRRQRIPSRVRREARQDGAHRVWMAPIRL